jgi:hypothetical protein
MTTILSRTPQKEIDSEIRVVAIVIAINNIHIIKYK